MEKQENSWKIYSSIISPLLILYEVSHKGKYSAVLVSNRRYSKPQLGIQNRYGGFASEKELKKLANMELCRKGKTGWRITRKGRVLAELWDEEGAPPSWLYKESLEKLAKEFKEGQVR